jgi:mRNA interferase MazF
MTDATDDRPPPSLIYRGELYWLGPDPSRAEAVSYAHPHLVVQEDLFNHSRVPTVILCALTTNLRRASEPGNVLLDPGEGSLARQSVVVVSQLESVHKSKLGARIGALSARRVDEVLAGLRFQQASFLRGR